MLDILFYTLSEAAALTNQNKETLKKKCQSGKIKDVKKIANVWLIPKEYVHGQTVLKAGVYIDGANMFHGGKEIGWLLDYEKVIDFIERKYSPAVLSFYDSIGFELDSKGKLLKDEDHNLIPKESELKFYKVLKGLGYRTVIKKLKLINNNPEEPKNSMDPYINIDILKENKSWEILLLFSGDSDFERILDELLPVGKRVHIFSFSTRLSYELKVRAFTSPLVSFTELDDLESILARRK